MEVSVVFLLRRYALNIRHILDLKLELYLSSVVTAVSGLNFILL